jgi:hypothetical protein
MYLDYTEDELHDKFIHMTTSDVVKYLMEEGLTLKAFKDFSDLPTGIYRRELGTDLVRFNGAGFNIINIFGYDCSEDQIEWACFDWDSGDGDWWVHVLSEENEPIHTIDRIRFRMNKDGQRLE